MAQLVYHPGQRRHLFAVRHLLPDPDKEECYIAGPLVAVYSSSSPQDVTNKVRRERPLEPPFAVIHVTGYMLALAQQGQGGFRVWVVEPGGEIHEHYVVSLVDMVRASWSVSRMP